jgi:hypothetical protein
MSESESPDLRINGAEVIVLSPDEQLVFWRALEALPKLNEEQRCLGEIMRGER